MAESDSRLAALEAAVASQSQRLVSLEALCATQQQQIISLERRLNMTGVSPTPPPHLAGSTTPPPLVEEEDARELSESSKKMITMVEQRLRASESFASPEQPPHSLMGAASPSSSPETAGRRRLDPVRGGNGLGPAPPPVGAPSGARSRPGSGSAVAGGGSERPASVDVPPTSASGLLTTSQLRPPGTPGNGPTALAARPHPALAPRTPLPSGGAIGGMTRPNLGSRTSPSRRGPSRPSSASRPSSGPPSRPSSREASRPSSRPPSAPRARMPALELLATLQGQSEQPVTAIAVTECGSGLVTAGLDGQLQLWSHGDDPQSLGTTTRSAQCWQRTLQNPVGGGEINGMALLGSVLACGCQDGSVRLFRLLKEAGGFVLYSMNRQQHSTQAQFVAAPPGQVSRGRPVVR